MPPRARGNWHDAYDAQMALWRWYRTKQGMDWLSYSYRENARNLGRSTTQMQRQLYESERTRLIDCDPIFVSAEMCEYVEYASASFQPEPLIETDLITPRGFLYYERPFEIPDRFDRPTTIAAMSWTRVFALNPPGSEQDRVAMIGPLEPGGPGAAEAERTLIEDHGARPYGITITIYASKGAEGVDHPGVPPVIPFHLTPWWFGMSFDGNEYDEIGEATGAEWWWKVAQSTFRLMQQKITAKRRYRPDRAARLIAKKAGLPDEAQVVVVRLRKEEQPRKESNGEPAHYSHRFVRSGHWRNQWYPSISEHRQIWIDPTIVGDSGLPLIVKPRRAFQWER